MPRNWFIGLVFQLKMIKTKNSLIIFFIVAILILAGIFAFVKMERNDEHFTESKQEQEKAATKQKWSVIYLTSGEIYVARLSYPASSSELSFPADSYMMQVTKAKTETGEEQSNFQLTPLNEFLWSPTELHVNRDQIIFYGPVDENSGVGKAIKDAGKWELEN